MTMFRFSGLTAAGAALLAASHASAQPPAAALREVHMGTLPQELFMAKIAVSDLVRSYEFYKQVLGLKLVSSPDLPPPKAPTAGDPEKDFVEVPMNYSGSMAQPMFVLVKRRGRVPTREEAGLMTIGFKVPDTQAVARRASAAGLKQSRPPIAGAHVIFYNDPDGYLLEILQAPSVGSP